MAAVQAKADRLTPGLYWNLEYQATVDCLRERHCEIDVQAIYCRRALEYDTTDEARILDLVIPHVRAETKNSGCPLLEGNWERTDAALNKLPYEEFLDMILKVVDEMEAECLFVLERKRYLGIVDEVLEEEEDIRYATFRFMISIWKKNFLKKREQAE